MIWPFVSTRPRRRPPAWTAFAAVSLLAFGDSPASAQAPRRAASAAPDGVGDPSGSPGRMALPADPGEPAKVDPRVEPAQAPDSLDAEARPAGGGGDDNPFPPAKERPGSAPPAAPGPGGADGGRFELPTNLLSMGKQEFGVSIEVKQPGPVVNLNKETTVNLVVKNTGRVEAHGVSVVYQLPDGLEFVGSLPEQHTQVPGSPSLYYWRKPTLATNGEWTIPVKVIARKVTTCDHAATVTAKAGARASVIVQEPKLKVEQTVTPTRVLKGEQVHFRISVRNTGTGPARNVIVQAKLSGGLRLGGDDIVEQTIPEIQPGQPIDLDVLTVDTVNGGPQTCTVDVRSPDVVPVPEDARAVRSVEVTQAELAVKLAGHDHRWTDQKNNFTLVVSNPGTATARNVRVVATMPPQGGRLLSIGEDSVGGEFDKKSRKIGWIVGQLEPKQSRSFSFVYLTGGPGLYSTVAEATSGELRSTDRVETNVEGLADIAVRIDASARVIDVGERTTYDIQIKNHGTREATEILLSGALTTNLKVVETSGTDQELKYNVKDGKFIFPKIDRLPPNGTLTLGIVAEAVARGKGTCRVLLDHADLPRGEGASEDNLIHAVANTTVTGERQPGPGASRP